MSRGRKSVTTTQPSSPSNRAGSVTPSSLDATREPVQPIITGQQSSRPNMDNQACVDRLTAQAEELFHLGMDCARSARKSQMLSHIESFTRQATRLLRLHNETALAIDRIRRHGEQKIVVQHVSVVANGPAVVSASVSGREAQSKRFGWTP